MRFLPRLPVFATLLLLCYSQLVAGDDFEASFRAGILTQYTDNLFRLSDEDKDDFDSEQAPGERFFGMSEDFDIVNRLRLETGLSWRLAKKRSFDIDFEASYYAHVENDVSDYPRYDGQLGLDVTKRDRIYAGADQIVDRFWKNYSVTGTAGFAPAVYDQLILRAGYRRKLGKHWRLGIEYRDQDRDYDPPLSLRDREGTFVAAHTRYRLAKRVDGRTEIHFGEVDVMLDTSGVTPIDRSFDETSVEQSFSFNLRKKQEIDLLLQYRRREYTTAETADLGRFDREDARTRLRIAYSKRLSKKLSLLVRATVTDNDSDRIDPTVATDEVGYSETSAGLGLGYRF